MIETLERNPERKSIAFDLDKYKEGISSAQLKDDVLSYLGEYRLRLKKYNYNLVFSDQNFEGPALRDSYIGEPMVVKAYRTLQERKSRQEPTHREEAELKGLINLDQELLSAKDNDTVLWASPMGSKEEGYGDYGFMFFGKVAEKEDKKTLSMTAIRLENPSIKDFNNALSVLTGQEINFRSAEDFLASPFVVNKIIDETILDGVLRKNFNFTASEDEESIFGTIIGRMDGMINDFINMVEMGVQEGKIRAFNALENYALRLKKEYEILPWENTIYDRSQRLGDIIGAYGYKPPTAAGSCGSSSSVKSNNPFSFGFDSLNNIFSEEDKYGERSFECPECGKTNIRPKDELIKNCQHCGSKDVACQKKL